MAKKTTRKHVTLQLAGKFIAELAKVTYKVLGLFGSPKKCYHSHTCAVTGILGATRMQQVIYIIKGKPRTSVFGVHLKPTLTHTPPKENITWKTLTASFLRRTASSVSSSIRLVLHEGIMLFGGRRLAVCQGRERSVIFVGSFFGRMEWSLIILSPKTANPSLSMIVADSRILSSWIPTIKPFPMAM